MTGREAPGSFNVCALLFVMTKSSVCICQDGFWNFGVCDFDTLRATSMGSIYRSLKISLPSPCPLSALYQGKAEETNPLWRRFLSELWLWFAQDKEGMAQILTLESFEMNPLPSLHPMISEFSHFLIDVYTPPLL